MRRARSAATLAWRLLTHDPGRLATSLGGLSFAVVLMLVQMGFRNSLLDSALALLESLNADVIVSHKDKRYFAIRDPIPRQRLYQTLSVPGVQAAFPIWVDELYWKNLEDGTQRPVRVLGFVPEDPVFTLEEVRRAAPELAWPDTALIDRRSRSYYGRLGTGPAQVQRHSLRVVGTFALATELGTDGNLIVGEPTFRMVGRTRRDQIEMVLVKAAPGVDPGGLAAALREALPTDVEVHTRDEIRRRDLDYWNSSTPVSVVVLIGMVMGFVVGVVICYQILYTDIMDHLAELSTLRAMGYGARFLVGIVLFEAAFLSSTAFVPSILIGAGLYALLAAATGFLVRLTLARAGLVLATTLTMSMIAAVLALRKALQADPAELF
jgi:putative ABC transport system permease protein